MAKEKITILGSDGMAISGKLKMSVPVDLNDANRRGVNIAHGGHDWRVHTEAKRTFMGGKKAIDRKVYVTVRNYTPDPALVLDAQSLSFLGRGEEGAYIGLANCGGRMELCLNQEDENFILEFETGAVRDCIEQQQSPAKSYPITFTVEVVDEEGNLLLSNPVEISVKFKPMQSKATIGIALPAAEITYSDSLGLHEIGKVQVSNASMLQYSPTAQCQCEFLVRRGENDEPNIWLDYAHVAMPEGASLKPDAGNARKFSVSGLHPAGQPISIPIYANFTAMGNPPASVGKYLFMLGAMAKNPGEEGAETADPATFTLNRNCRQPSMEVTVTDPCTGKAYNLLNDPNPKLERISFTPGEHLTNNISINISNAATAGPRGSGVVIRNVQYSVHLPANARVVYSTAADSLQTFVGLAAPAETLVANKPDSSEQWRIVLNADAVRDIYIKKTSGQREYKLNLKVEIAFDYCLDAEGRCQILPGYFEGNKKAFKATITVPIFQCPDPRWLAIDFGTSAIVAQYDNIFINLHNQKNLLNANADEDTYEVGSPFLSSNLIFRDTRGNGDRSSLLSQLPATPVPQFSSLAVCLSPKSTFELANIQRVIPCLKMIVGYDLLPNMQNYADFRYNYADGAGALQKDQPLVLKQTNDYGEEVEVWTPLAKVDTIFGEVYKELFTYFVSPSVRSRARRINQLVLTVPNTYTPYHLQRLRQIVTEGLNESNLRNVVFVSESDAVACFYQLHWHEINKRLGRENDAKLQESETVLVYDMGAGTLDVTLFHKEAKNGQVKITVLGKLGLAKAGNYLDCLLAQLMSRIPGLEKLANFAYPDNITNNDRLRSAMKLKALIKNEIKPLLSEKDAKYTFKADPSLGVLDDVEVDILNHLRMTKEYTAFMGSVTKDMVENFFHFFFENDPSLLRRIDTVLLSGRSTKLSAIEANLKVFLRAFQSPDMKVVKLSDFTPAGSDVDLSKTVVAEGAVGFASLLSGAGTNFLFSSNNIMANYGVIYNTIHGEAKYEELLNPRLHQPVKVENIEGQTISSYDSPVVTLDLSTTPRLKLVQTFSRHTMDDLNSGNSEYITQICEVNVASLADRRNVRLQLKVDKDNMMTLVINDKERSDLTTSKIDIDSMSNRMSLWPMVRRSSY